MTEKQSAKEWEPKIVAIVCNWCTYAGADLAGISRIQYPPNVRIIRVPCTGRINPFYVLKALQEGADGVLVSGCHPGECHYITGNLMARRKFAALKSFLNYIGVEGDRTLFTWVSASEGDRFAQVIRGVTDAVRELGPASKLVKKLQGTQTAERGISNCGKYRKKAAGRGEATPDRKEGGRGRRVRGGNPAADGNPLLHHERRTRRRSWSGIRSACRTWPNSSTTS